MRSKSYYLKV